MFLWANWTEVWHSCLFWLSEIYNFFRFKSEVLSMNTSLFERFFSFKTILNAPRKPIRQTFRKISAKKVGNWQNGSSNIRKCDKIRSPGYVIFSLEKAAKRFSGNLAFFAQSLKKNKKMFLLFNIVFFSKCFYGLIEQKFGILADFFVENLKLFRSNSETH